MNEKQLLEHLLLLNFKVSSNKLTPIKLIAGYVLGISIKYKYYDFYTQQPIPFNGVNYINTLNECGYALIQKNYKAISMSTSFEVFVEAECVHGYTNSDDIVKMSDGQIRKLFIDNIILEL